jgi:hypothetical protein
MVNKATQIAHSLTQSGVQGVPSMHVHPLGQKPCTLNKTESIAPVYINEVKHHVIYHNASSSRINV